MRKLYILAFLLAIIANVAFAATRYLDLKTVGSNSTITSVSFDFDNQITTAVGSDIWTTTWHSDGNQYFGWGDGGGFWGTDTAGKVSLGFGYISSLPPTLSAYNVWGRNATAASGSCTSPSIPCPSSNSTACCARYSSQFCGKSDSMISIGGVLYSIVSSSYNGTSLTYDTGTACPTNPTPMTKIIISSANNGQTWTPTSWHIDISGTNMYPSTFINYGESNANAPSEGGVTYVYVILHKNGSGDRVYLMRAPVANILANPTTTTSCSSGWCYYTGLSGGNPTWATTATNAQPIYVDSGKDYIGMTVAWDNGLNQYIAAEGFGDNNGQLAILSATKPWGPYQEAYRSTDWGGLGADGSGLGFQIPTKWISSDGLTVWLVYTPSDRFGAIKMTLATGNQITLTSVNADLITTSGATVDFISSLQCTGSVEYGTDTSYGSTASDAGGLTSHAISLSSLNQNTTYFYRVSCGNATPATGSFSTIATPSVNVATYLMDTSPGQTVDSSASSPSNTLTITGAASIPTTGVVCTGQGLYFSGATDKASTTGVSASLSNLSAFTYCAVIYPMDSSANGTTIISKESTTFNDDFHINYYGNYIGATVYNTQGSKFETKSALNTFPKNERHQFCVTFDSTSATDHKVHIYEDGSATEVAYQAQPDFIGSLKTSTNVLNIGNSADSGTRFNGVIDSVYVDNYVVDASTRAARNACDTPPNITCGTNNICRYISPSGNNASPTDNDCSNPSFPCKTFAYAIPKLQPGDALNLVDGTYSAAAGTGVLNIDCGTTGNAAKGTAANPIAIQAVNERQALLQSDGSVAAFKINNCSYWDIKGLRMVTADLDMNHGGAQYNTVQVDNSDHLTFTRLLISKNNRYFNVDPFSVATSSYVTIEESELYNFARHGINLFSGTNLTSRRNYINSRGSVDLKCDGNATGCTAAGHCNDSYATGTGSGTGPCCSTTQAQNSNSGNAPGKCPRDVGNNTIRNCASGYICGYWSILTDRGDEGITGYNSVGTTIENTISEGNNILASGANGTGATANRVLGSISLNEVGGLFTQTSASHSDDGVIIANSVGIAGAGTTAACQGKGMMNVHWNNDTCFGSAGGQAFIADNGCAQTSCSGATCVCTSWATYSPSVSVLNMLAMNAGSYWYHVMSNYTTPGTWSVDRSYRDANTNSSPATTNAKYTNWNTSSVASTLIGTGTNQCLVYIPGGHDGKSGTNPLINGVSSSLVGAGAGGADIGANIVYEYVNGTLSSQKLWCQSGDTRDSCKVGLTGAVNEGQFPCGQTVNDVSLSTNSTTGGTTATNACINVNRRLNVNYNGCLTP